MLLSILMDDQGQTLAGAMACDQVPLGNDYWVEVLGLPPDLLRDCKTAVIEIEDAELADRLSNLHLERRERRGEAWKLSGIDNMGLQPESPAHRRSAA